MGTQLDLIAIGRVSVDLYGQQIGSRLEDVSTFAKAVGGCPANVAIGAARLGLKSALVTRVGDEPMGRFVREQLAREGVDTRATRIDPQRLTSLVLLSVRDPHSFPLIFYRDNCADAALSEDDIEETFIASSRAVLVTGTHFSIPSAASAQRKAVAVAKRHGARVILDVDYRPNLWGIGGHGAGESRYAQSARVTGILHSLLPDCDLIVGTEEELHVAAGIEDTLGAVRRIREVSKAVIVCKRGPGGCIVFADGMPARLEDGLVAGAMEVEVYNVLGAGDAFLAGFLRGYLRDEPHELSARLANACGALAVSRLLCSPEFPTLAELEHYLARGSAHRALREDAGLNHLHWATTRARMRADVPPSVLALKVDPPPESGSSAAPDSAARERASAFQALAVDAVVRVAAGRDGFGVVLGQPRGAALPHALSGELWVAQSVERPASKPLEFEAASVATQLQQWPGRVTVKCSCRYRPEDPPELRRAQERNLLRIAAACRAQGRELLLEISTGAGGAASEGGVALVLSRLYALAIRPDWWGLELQPDANAWERCARAIADEDPYCRGVLVCGELSLEERAATLALAASVPIVRGFIAGGSIITGAARAWLSGEISDEATVLAVAARFAALVDSWTERSAT